MKINLRFLCLFTILIVVISAPQVSSEDELVQLLELSNTQISDEDSKTMPLVEFFFSPGYENVTSELHQLEDVANVIHWRISAEEEGLNWPNDDANIRADQLSVYDYPAIVINGNLYTGNYDAESIRQHIVNLNEDESIPSLVDMDGTVQVAQQSDGLFRVILKLDMTPVADLPIGTTANIILSEDYITDEFGRNAHNLVREWKPETGFMLSEGNTTNLSWSLTDIHLEAAGVDFLEKPRGWKIHVLYFDEFQESGSKILSVHTVELNPPQNQISTNDFLIFIPIIIAMIVVLGIILRGINNVDESLPEITAVWKNSESTKLTIIIQAKERDISLKTTLVEEPWKLQGRAKSLDIESFQSKNLELKFTKSKPEPVRIRLGLEIEDLGEWTQTIEMPTIK